MTFTRIDRSTWPREEYFRHYFTQVPCTYSATFKLDITRLRQRGKSCTRPCCFTCPPW